MTYTAKRMFPATYVHFGGLDNMRLHSGGQTREKPSQNGSQISKIVK